MDPRIEKSEEKKLVGMSMKMRLTNHKTAQLWGQFAPRIKEIQSRSSEDKISLQIYPPLYHKEFNPDTEFEKWATVEVNDFNMVPDGMDSFVLQEGLYAVFDYKGSGADHSIFEYIFTGWLPNSGYVLDNRPHFEVLGAKYRNNDPNSEEAIWIPVTEN